MLKRYAIFFFLTAAYSVLLAHNFTPHQHNKTATKKHHHHHDKHTHHDHDNDDSDQQTGTFHHFQHIGEWGIEYTSGNSLRSPGQEKIFQVSCERSAIIAVHPFERPPLIVHFERSGLINISQKTPYFFQLKAPPAFTA